MLAATVITCTVRRNSRDLYEMFWRPESFLRWASGLSGADLEPDGNAWTTQRPDGTVRTPSPDTMSSA